MIGQLAALILLSTMSLIESAEDPHLISLAVVEVGGNFTFQCPVLDNKGKQLSLFKQSLGQMAQPVFNLIFGRLTVTEPFLDTRFTATKDDTHYLFTIRNVSKEDEATYFCLTGWTYSLSFGIGIFLDVNDQQKSFYVKQSPKTKSVQPGDSVTLECSLISKNNKSADQCTGEHNVSWFRSGSGESHPSIIYTHSDEQKERSCVFSLSKTIHKSSDTGTYYCAVATCGQILFGEGTTVETRTVSRTDDVFLLLPSVVSAISVIVIAILIHAIKRNKCDYCHNKAAVYLQENVAKRNVKRNEDPWIYSTVVFTVMETGPGVYTAAKAF
ncbi:uncharacterized protein LOC117541081 isoform X2 [Gymnodraco acuticeps]|uniref:Uncharacterized protein LOC117541081 isoform X2 n=1 Tax=Gymnodraco acuticeps TaxID=8218 RepID=A0A6P8TJ57_GYMAC|nr:uncharacterized protein LOC117541081 isoform X2 [Gymnodraco acuticeps]